MNGHPVFRPLWRLVNASVILLALLLPLTAAWEFSTRQYLKGFAIGIVPPDGGSQGRVITIMSWIEDNSARKGATDTNLLTVRDPENTLNSGKLLSICGSATNAFVNLAGASGVPARRLLLLNPGGTANHVVAEVELNGHWYVVDPVFRIIPRGSSGQWLMASDLRDSATLASVTRNLPAYRSDYNYLRTAHLRFGRVPILGPLAGRILARLWPGWDGAIFWTLLTERESFAAFIGAAILLFGFLVLRIIIKTYGLSRLKISPSEMGWTFHRTAAMRSSVTGPV
jgi:hypothetical protein